MFATIKEAVRSLSTTNRRAHNPAPRFERLSLEALEDRLAPSAITTSPAQPTPVPEQPTSVPEEAALLRQQLTHAQPLLTFQSATQSGNDAAILFVNSILTLLTPPVPPLPPTPNVPPPNYSIFGSTNTAAELSSLGVVNPGVPLSVGVLSAEIMVLSASSSPVQRPAPPPPSDFQSYYPVSTGADVTTIAALDAVWGSNPDFAAVSGI